ncbi:hypothetical protein AAES_114541 [Amazona aestiva]|uniref:Uncharacterized protein n=1 Tax=Amazona aestiva TaxID=12930 RepID=A0A0Q3M705_AMAAE|nr:hypothetical protein AAES_114541 [Amazona aestiva]
MVNTRRMSKARSGSSALAEPVVASVGTETEPMGKEAAVQSSGCRERLHCYPKGRVSNGQGCTLRSLVEVLLQQVAELQEAVTGLKGVREAEGEKCCLLRDQPVQGPPVSTVAHGGKEAAKPGSWEKSSCGRNDMSITSSLESSVDTLNIAISRQPGNLGPSDQSLNKLAVAWYLGSNPKSSKSVRLPTFKEEDVENRELETSSSRKNVYLQYSLNFIPTMTLELRDFPFIYNQIAHELVLPRPAKAEATGYPEDICIRRRRRVFDLILQEWKMEVKRSKD